MSQQDDDSAELFASEGDNSEVQLNVEFADPTPAFEIEIRTLASAFWSQTPHSSISFKLAEVVANQPEVGTVACGFDKDVLGFHSIVNMGQHMQDESVSALFDQFLDTLDSYRSRLPVAQQFWRKLEAGAVTFGLLATGRYANLPMAAIAAFYRVVKEDLDWVAGSEYNSSTPVHLLRFTHILHVTKGMLKDSDLSLAQLIKKSTNPISYIQKRGLARPEDASIIDCSLFTLLVPASLGSFTCWVFSILDMAGYTRVTKILADDE